MDKLNFLTDKTKQIMGLVASMIIILTFVAPQMPAAPQWVAPWGAWVSQLVGLMSLFLGLQVFNPSKNNPY